MSPFGLDIGSHSIKIVQLSPEGKRWRLAAAGVVPTPTPGMLTESEKALVEVAESIKKLVTSARITAKEAVFSLPESKVYTRLVSFPPLTDTELASAIEWQIESYIPIPKKDAVYDHQIVSRGEKEVEVLLVAAPKVVANKYIKVLELAGFTTLAVETELLALSRSIAPKDRRSLVIDFGASSTDCAVVIGGQLMFSRSIPTAGEAITRAVAKGIEVAPAQAEEYKRTYGLKEKALEGKVKESINPVLSMIIDELKKVAGYWLSDHPEQAIETVVVSGGGAGLQSLTPLLTEKLGVEANVGDPFAQILKDDNTARHLAPYAPLYAIAVGLAMRP